MKESFVKYGGLNIPDAKNESGVNHSPETHITEPSEEDLKELGEKYKVNPAVDVDDILSNERPPQIGDFDKLMGSQLFQENRPDAFFLQEIFEKAGYEGKSADDVVNQLLSSPYANKYVGLLNAHHKDKLSYLSSETTERMLLASKSKEGNREEVSISDESLRQLIKEGKIDVIVDNLAAILEDGWMSSDREDLIYNALKRADKISVLANKFKESKRISDLYTRYLRESNEKLQEAAREAERPVNRIIRRFKGFFGR